MSIEHIQVKKGDRLADIAASRNIRRWQWIMDANPGAFTSPGDPRTLRAGAVIHLDTAWYDTVTPPAPPPAKATIKESDDIGAIVADADPGEVLLVEPGAVFHEVHLSDWPDGVVLAADAADGIFTFEGHGNRQQAITGSADSVTIEGLHVRGYGGFVDPSWQGTRRGNGFRPPAAVHLAGFTNAHIRRSVVEACDSGWFAPKSGVMLACAGSHNKQANILGNSVDGLQIVEFVSEYANEEWWFDDDFEAGSKFVACQNVTIDKWTAHHNNGVGLWFDFNNRDITVRRALCTDNASKGFSYELSTGPLLVEESTFLRNGGAANLHIADSAGTPDDPLLFRDCDAGEHTRHGWQTAIQDTSRGFTGHIRFEGGTMDNIIVDPVEGVEIPGVEVVGVVNSAGGLVTPTWRR